MNYVHESNLLPIDHVIFKNVKAITEWEENGRYVPMNVIEELRLVMLNVKQELGLLLRMIIVKLLSQVIKETVM